MDYDTTLIEYIKALRHEITYLKEQGGKQYRLSNGKQISNKQDGYIYSFETDTELYLPDSTPMRVEIGNLKSSGEIIYREGFHLMIFLKSTLGSNVSVAFMYCEPWKLIEGLIDRLEECISNARRGQSRLLVEDGTDLSLPVSEKSILKGQKSARKHTLGNPITMIWGPPGTGKTYTLSQIAIDYCTEGKKVLIVSHSNVSVDGAVNKILNILKERDETELIDKGKILRFGYVRDKKLADHPTATSNNFVLLLHPELAKDRKEIDEQMKSIKNNFELNSYQIDRINDLKKNLALKMREYENAAVKGASIVATTISKATVDPLFYENVGYDVVIFDEASMAYVPQIIYASSLAAEKFICLGDFKQLAPIAQSKEASEILMRDIFNFTNISTLAGSVNYHPWLVMLNTQRRMHVNIAEFVNRNIYHKGIINDETVKDVTATIAKNAPFPDYSMAFVNLEGTYNVSAKNSDNSRFNIMSALISFFTAVDAEKNCSHSLGIITPYAAQARLIRAMIMDYKKNNSTNITCATIHQFQGSERDIIIFDAVESYRQARAGTLMTSNENNHIKRLVNVAVTRARGKLITVANWGFWFNQLYGKQSILMDLIRFQRENGKEIADQELKKYLTNSNNYVNFYLPNDDCAEALRNDLDNVKKSMVISLPDGYIRNIGAMSAGELIDIAMSLKERGVKLIVNAENINTIPKRLRNDAVESKDIWFPLMILDNKTTWYGVPAMNVNFVHQKTELKTRHWFAIRFSGEHTADIVVSLADLKTQPINETRKVISNDKQAKIGGLAKFITNNCICKICQQPLVLKKNIKYYCSCTKCKYTQFVTVDMINDYVYAHKLKCKKHSCFIEGKLSKYGVYAWCPNGYEPHSVDLADL